MELLKLVINKCISGRFLMTVAFTITSCVLAVKGTFPVEAFVGLATLIANSYFNRDRADEAPKP